MLIEWDERRFTMGVPELDRDHRDLVDRINQLHDLLADGPSPEVIESHIGGLRRQAGDHFAREEAFLERAGSRHAEAHRILHEILMEDLDRALTEARKDRFRFLREDLEFEIKPWLLAHIVEVDRKLPI